MRFLGGRDEMELVRDIFELLLLSLYALPLLVLVTEEAEESALHLTACKRRSIPDDMMMMMISWVLILVRVEVSGRSIVCLCERRVCA